MIKKAFLYFILHTNASVRVILKYLITFEMGLYHIIYLMYYLEDQDRSKRRVNHSGIITDNRIA